MVWSEKTDEKEKNMARREIISEVCVREREREGTIHSILCQEKKHTTYL
jgi:hypothetical protein